MTSRKRERLAGVDCEECGGECLEGHLHSTTAPAPLRNLGPICPDCDTDAYEQYSRWAAGVEASVEYQLGAFTPRRPSSERGSRES